ncbi:hypothetical protein [Pontibacter mangrovi]|uniref:DUF4843 domain-containing protein n=1 Tax=Pontibacter mangrovi TaxID=2589816 RepID=A0A501VT56_9BACT|nr:hypothetical protein [Pontibacter mangrovi]TPE40268.1 hypothetical protein FJM65_20215 [Pontibacter mangrovi]
MRRMMLMAVLLLAVVASACEKIEDLLTFYVNEEETFTIDSGFPLGALVPATPFTVTTNSEETFKNNKTRAALVKNVSLNRLELTITDPKEENFDFLKRIELYISSENEPELKIAYLDEVPEGATTLKLKSTNAKLDEYIKSNNYTIRTMAEIAKPVAEDITIKADMRFKVTADPL